MKSNAIDQRIRESFDRQGLMHTLGATLRSVGNGTCSVNLPFSSRVTQQHGFFHGGAIASIADSAAGYAAFTTMAADQQPLTVEFKISLISPARGDRVEARGTVIKSGRRLKFVESKVYAIDVEQETLVAIALATITSSRQVAETSTT